MKPAILTNLNICTGCWSCVMACKIGNKLADDQWWMKVNTLPSGVTDEPSGTWPNVKMSWLPVAFPQCTLCPTRTAQNLEPYCVFNCPTQARTYGDLDDPMSKASIAMKGYRDKGYKIYQLPDAGSTTHAAFHYAEKRENTENTVNYTLAEEDNDPPCPTFLLSLIVTEKDSLSSSVGAMHNWLNRSTIIGDLIVQSGFNFQIENVVIQRFDLL